jgi:hypothetical protein
MITLHCEHHDSKHPTERNAGKFISEQWKKASKLVASKLVACKSKENSATEKHSSDIKEDYRDLQ